MNWWSMPARTEEQKAARAKAKTEYYAANDRTPRRVKGGFVAPDGTFYAAADTVVSRKCAQWLIMCGHPPIPCFLRFAEDGPPTFVGASGRTYAAFPFGQRSFVISLDHAIAEEERVWLQRGIDPEERKA